MVTLTGDCAGGVMILRSFSGMFFGDVFWGMRSFP